MPSEDELESAIRDLVDAVEATANRAGAEVLSWLRQMTASLRSSQPENPTDATPPASPSDGGEGAPAQAGEENPADQGAPPEDVPGPSETGG